MLKFYPNPKLRPDTQEMQDSRENVQTRDLLPSNRSFKRVLFYFILFAFIDYIFTLNSF